jgi:soluble lytic murein transglycosylase
MMLLLAWPQTTKPPQFPRAAARTYLTSADPPTPRLGGEPARPSDAEVSAAEKTLRKLADNSAVDRGERALAEYALGRGEAGRGNTDLAAQDLAAAAAWGPIQDAATADLIRLLAASQDNSGVLAAAERYPVDRRDPFAAAIGKEAAAAAAALHNWTAAAEWAGRFPDDPEMIWIAAQAADGAGQERAAAELERKLVYEYPASKAAKAALPSWQEKLRSDRRLAAGWELTAKQAAAWNAAGRYQLAAESWAQAESMAPHKEQARLLALETRAWLHAGHLVTTATRLKRLERSSERAQALEIEVELARHKGRSQDIPAALRELAQDFPHSVWYARALHEAGNDAVLAGDDAAVEARLERLSRQFPSSAYAPQALWRAAWTAFRSGDARTPVMLEKYLRSYPKGPAAVDALYWRGVWAEQHGDSRVAQACFQAAAEHFPGTYFGQEASKRVGREPAGGSAPAWLAPFVSDPATPQASPVPQAYAGDIERATWLQQAGLLDPAATILAHVAYALPARDSLTVARQLAAVDEEREAWSQAMVVMIRAVPGYMELQPDQLTTADWRALFPAPFADDLQAVAQQFGLDRALLLGLIRQESGFNPASLSRASARGLMQLVLGTARGRLRQLPTGWQALKGRGRLSADDLFNPSLNMALGAAELQDLLQEFGQPAYALAGYNAGASRVRAWQQQFPNLGLDAFIESVPFSETRGYIQAVLRNAQRYREIYGEN